MKLLFNVLDDYTQIPGSQISQSLAKQQFANSSENLK